MTTTTAAPNTANTADTRTTHQRFKDALRDARRAGVHTRQNVRECCRSCIGAAKLGLAPGAMDTTPHAFTYGGQGHAITWRDGMPYYSDMLRKADNAWSETGRERFVRRARADTIYFNHGGPGVQAATALAAAFRAHGLTVEWDGTATRCVEVKIEWPEDPA